MHEWLVATTEHVVVAIHTLAALVIVVATAHAGVDSARALAASWPEREKREIWLRYARWLIAGLTFQLAADIVETSVHTTWDAIGRLGAIAVIRTFLNYFLERDLEKGRRRQFEE